MGNEDYPVAAFVITLIGAVLSLVYGVIYVIIGAYFVVGSYMISHSLAFFASMCLILGFIGGLVALIAAFMMKDPDKVHTGGLLAIIAAFLSVGGILTFILLLIGGILALTWKRPEKKAVILPPPPPS